MHIEIRDTDSPYNLDCLVDGNLVGQFTDAEFGRWVATFDSPSRLAGCFEALGATPGKVAGALAYSILMCVEGEHTVGANGKAIS